MRREGWQGWDEYAPFYDWENARTLGRRDIPFWRNVAAKRKGLLLELGCGTGRISLPLARAGVRLVGVDRSAHMLARALRRATTVQAKRQGHGRARGRLRLVRADIRVLPFRPELFSTVIAPYGILQSLLRDSDLQATLDSVRTVLKPGGLFGLDLVPDVPNWREYNGKVQLKGRTLGGAHLTLVETVRHDRRRHLTIFEQVYRERRAGKTVDHQFDLTFRTLPIPQMTERLTRAGFAIEAVLGDYRGRPWDERADVWIVLARRTV